MPGSYLDAALSIIEDTDGSALIGRLPVAVTAGDVTVVGAASGTTIAATTLYAVPDDDESDGAVFRVDAYIITTAAETTGGITADLKLLHTDGANVFTEVVGLMAADGAVDVVITTTTADLAYTGSKTFRCDKATNIQYSSTASAAGTGDGTYDIVLRLVRLS